jgi:hypothetical protein
MWGPKKLYFGSGLFKSKLTKIRVVICALKAAACLIQKDLKFMCTVWSL